MIDIYKPIFDSYADAVDFLVLYGDGKSIIQSFRDGDKIKYRLVRAK